MLRNAFEVAVVGPIATEPLAVAGSCAHCVATSAPGALACNGFGPGCLVRSPEKVTGVNRRAPESPLD
jgi:hypothetical protein